MPYFVILIYAALIGATVGSFLNVCVYRWPNNLSVVRPRSRCPHCEAAIAWYDNVPVLGYLFLRARCRGCQAPISIQYPLIEVATSLIWIAVAVQFGPSIEALRGAIFLTILLGIALTDAKHMVIPDQFSLGGALIGLVFAAAPGTIPFRSALLGAVVGYLLMRGVAYGGEKLFRKPALGLGDVHMMALVGAFLGAPRMALTILLGSVLGIAIGVPITWFSGRLVRMETYLPLGTFLAMGAAVAYLWGEAIIGWYLNFALGGG
jgi:leader peptidase (prepilin peptidase)/N-methyltransferase